MDIKDKQYKKMTETPVRRLIMSLSVPTIISMLVTAIYNMADTFFVGQLGKSASGAVGIVFSIMAIIQAIGFTLGMGSGTWISRLLGRKDNEKASRVATTGIFMGLVLGIVISVVGIVFIDKILILCGATDTILPHAKNYALYILLAAPIMICSFILNNILRSEGKARFSMIGITAGGVLNIALDPLFIYVFDLGTAGAAIATAISQLVSVIILLIPFIIRKTETKLSVKRIELTALTPFHILKNGFPSFCRQGLASLATILLNTAASDYGDAAISAMSITGKIFMMVFSVVIGLGQGYQPVLGYNYSAGFFKRVRTAAAFMLEASYVIVIVIGGALAIFSGELIGLFINDAEVVSIGVTALRLQCLGLAFVPVGILANMTLQSIGDSFKASFLSSLRQGIFFIPLILILPKYVEILGVQITQGAADVLTFFVSLPFYLVFLKKLPKEDKPINQEIKE